MYAIVDINGNQTKVTPDAVLEVPALAGEPGAIRAVQLTVAAAADGVPPGARPITFEVRAANDPATRVAERSTFVLP